MSDEALVYLSTAVDGSFRDGVKILDQVLSNSDSVSIEEIEALVSGRAGYKISGLIEALVKKDVSESLTKLSEATMNGVDLTYLLVSLMRGMRDKLLTGGVEIDATKLIFSLDEVARRLATSLDGELLIQVAIVEWCGSAGAENNQSSNDNNQSKNKKESEKSELKKAEKREEEQVSSRAESRDPSASVGMTSAVSDATDIWKQVLLSLGQNNLALDTILSKAWPGTMQGNELTIYVQYDFHRQQLMSEKNLVKLEEMITKAVGCAMKVKIEVSIQQQKSNPPPPMASEGHGDTIDEAIAIFS